MTSRDQLQCSNGVSNRNSNSNSNSNSSRHEQSALTSADTDLSETRSDCSDNSHGCSNTCPQSSASFFSKNQCARLAPLCTLYESRLAESASVVRTALSNASPTVFTAGNNSADFATTSSCARLRESSVLFNTPAVLFYGPHTINALSKSSCTSADNASPHSPILRSHTVLLDPRAAESCYNGVCDPDRDIFGAGAASFTSGANCFAFAGSLAHWLLCRSHTLQPKDQSVQNGQNSQELLLTVPSSSLPSRQILLCLKDFQDPVYVIRISETTQASGIEIVLLCGDSRLVIVRLRLLERRVALDKYFVLLSDLANVVALSAQNSFDSIPHVAGAYFAGSSSVPAQRESVRVRPLTSLHSLMLYVRSSSDALFSVRLNLEWACSSDTSTPGTYSVQHFVSEFRLPLFESIKCRFFAQQMPISFCGVAMLEPSSLLVVRRDSVVTIYSFSSKFPIAAVTLPFNNPSFMHICTTPKCKNTKKPAYATLVYSHQSGIYLREILPSGTFSSEVVQLPFTGLSPNLRLLDVAMPTPQRLLAVCSGVLSYTVYEYNFASSSWLLISDLSSINFESNVKEPLDAIKSDKDSNILDMLQGMRTIPGFIFETAVSRFCEQFGLQYADLVNSCFTATSVDTPKKKELTADAVLRIAEEYARQQRKTLGAAISDITCYASRTLRACCQPCGLHVLDDPAIINNVQNGIDYQVVVVKRSGFGLLRQFTPSERLYQNLMSNAFLSDSANAVTTQYCSPASDFAVLMRYAMEVVEPSVYSLVDADIIDSKKTNSTLLALAKKNSPAIFAQIVQFAKCIGHDELRYQKLVSYSEDLCNHLISASALDILSSAENQHFSAQKCSSSCEVLANPFKLFLGATLQQVTGDISNLARLVFLVLGVLEETLNYKIRFEFVTAARRILDIQAIMESETATTVIEIIQSLFKDSNLPYHAALKTYFYLSSLLDTSDASNLLQIYLLPPTQPPVVQAFFCKNGAFSSHHTLATASSDLMIYRTPKLPSLLTAISSSATKNALMYRRIPIVPRSARAETSIVMLDALSNALKNPMATKDSSQGIVVMASKTDPVAARVFAALLEGFGVDNLAAAVLDAAITSILDTSVLLYNDYERAVRLHSRLSQFGKALDAIRAARRNKCPGASRLIRQLGPTVRPSDAHVPVQELLPRLLAMVKNPVTRAALYINQKNDWASAAECYYSLGNAEGVMLAISCLQMIKIPEERFLLYRGNVIELTELHDILDDLEKHGASTAFRY